MKARRPSAGSPPYARGASGAAGASVCLSGFGQHTGQKKAGCVRLRGRISLRRKGAPLRARGTGSFLPGAGRRPVALRLVCGILYKKNRKRTVLSRRAFLVLHRGVLYEEALLYYFAIKNPSRWLVPKAAKGPKVAGGGVPHAGLSI